MKESKLQSEMFQWHWNNRPKERRLLIHLHNNPRSVQEGAMLKSMGLIKGASDFIYCRPNSLPVFIEVKTPLGKMSAHQERFKDAVMNAGFMYFVVKTLEEFKSVIKREYLLESM